MTPEERLAAVLDERDEEIEALKCRIEDLEREAEFRKINGSEWALPFEEEDQRPDLPLPRLEVLCAPTTDVFGDETWSTTTFEYRLVRAIHSFTPSSHVRVTVLMRSRRSGGSNKPPWWPADTELPDAVTDAVGGTLLSANAWRIIYGMPSFHNDCIHDAAHLRIPLYVQTAKGMERLDHLGGQGWARAGGEKSRRC